MRILFKELLPKVDRTPHKVHTISEIPTLPEFMCTPLGAIKIPLPTTDPTIKE